MYKEVALDPHCLSEFHYYGLLKTNFGFEKGRYAVAPLKEWVREAVQSVKASNMPPIKQHSVKNYLNKLQKNKNNPFIILPNDRKTLEGNTNNWVEWVTIQIAHRAFNTVVSERDVKDSLSYAEILEGDDKWSISPTQWIEKSEQAILTAIKPLLYIGNELVIVDQYFRVAGNKVLQAIFRELQINHTIKKITLVTSVDTANPQQVYQREFTNRFQYLPEFTYLKVPERYFHDRYMITDKATIKAGHGFSGGIAHGGQADRLSISLCGKEESDETNRMVESLKNNANATLIVMQ